MCMPHATLMVTSYHSFRNKLFFFFLSIMGFKKDKHMLQKILTAGTFWVFNMMSPIKWSHRMRFRCDHVLFSMSQHQETIIPWCLGCLCWKSWSRRGKRLSFSSTWKRNKRICLTNIKKNTNTPWGRGSGDLQSFRLIWAVWSSLHLDQCLELTCPRLGKFEVPLPS